MAADLRYLCLCKCLSVAVLTTGCVCLLILALPIAEIILGVVYLHDCPVSPLIPVYVMVCGILAILLFALIGGARFLRFDVSENYLWMGSLITLILFWTIWFFYGSYLIYSIHPPNFIKSSNSSSLDVSAAELRPEPYNQTQNLQSLNQTEPIHQRNQTLLDLIQTLSRNSSAQGNTEHLNASPPVAAALYCNKTMYMFAYWTTSAAWFMIAAVLGLLFDCNKTSSHICH